MSVTYPQSEPESFRAGESVIWQKPDVANYSYAEGFTTAKYTLNGKNGSASVDGVWDASADKWTFTLAAADNTLSAGTYILYGYVQNASGEIHGFVETSVEVKDSLVTAAQVDTRSHVKKVLDAAEAVLEKRATREQESTQTPDGVALSLLSPEKLVALIDNYRFKYREELDAQRVANGGSRRRIVAAFGQDT